MSRINGRFRVVRRSCWTIGLLSLAIATSPAQSALALIEGGEGNDPITDPGWPKGAAKIFNHPNRAAYWVGPPFGGGQWHAECRGDAEVLSDVLADFAKIDAKIKRVVVHNGVGRSFWLNPNRDKAKEADAKIDWTFMVWQPALWERLRKLPGDLRPADAGETDPPVQLDIYSGNLKWAEVTIPEGLKIVDDRMEAHGFMPSDGVVLEGTALDLDTQKPLSAKMRLELIEPQKKGGYKYTTQGEAIADSKGRWVLRKAPAGWFRIIVEAEGYVPRIVGHAQFDEEPRWTAYNSGLSRAVTVAGQVSDAAGKPLADVSVRLADVVAKVGGRYDSPGEYKVQTDAEGRFRLDQVPVGNARVWIHKAGYCRPGLGETIATPKEDISLKMMLSARIRVTIDFADQERPTGYMVSIAPEGGEVVGSWGGSGNIDSKNQISFEDVPPGKYVIFGRPNPGSDNQKTDPITVDLKGGKTEELKLKAK